MFESAVLGCIHLPEEHPCAKDLLLLQVTSPSLIKSHSLGKHNYTASHKQFTPVHQFPPLLQIWAPSALIYVPLEVAEGPLFSA